MWSATCKQSTSILERVVSPLLPYTVLWLKNNNKVKEAVSSLSFCIVLWQKNNNQV